MHIGSQAQIIERHMTVRFTGHSRIVRFIIEPVSCHPSDVKNLEDFSWKMCVPLLKMTSNYDRIPATLADSTRCSN